MKQKSEYFVARAGFRCVDFFSLKNSLDLHFSFPNGVSS